MTMTATAHKNKERGRPGEFDIEQALDHAMIVFRRKGYPTASIRRLKISSLFLLVFERYLLLRKGELRRRLAPCVSGRGK